MQSARRMSGLASPALAAIALMVSTPTLAAEPPPSSEQIAAPAYADLADLADSAELVLRAQVRKLVRIEDARAPGLRTGWGRFYIMAKTSALLTGHAPVGETLAYLADLPLDEKGKPSTVKKAEVILFARTVPGRPGELSLVAPDAQLNWNEGLEARLRPILAELASDKAPAGITGVREIIYVPGTLAGEGETQIFLATDNDSASSITVRHLPGMPPVWGVSFSELIADVGHPPQPDTLAWYRLACFLPKVPPNKADISDTAANRAQAQADYRMVMGELGPCIRNRK